MSNAYDIAEAPPQHSDIVPEPKQVEDIQTGAAGRMARGTLRGDKTPETALPKVASDDDYQRVKPGSFYLDPEGQKRKRLYEVKDANDYGSVPEGEEYIDPDGKTRQKPNYEGVNFTSQTLFNMAVNDKERKKALELSYPGKVKQEGSEFIVDDGGTLRKPRGMTQTAIGLGAGLTSAAAPTVGAVGGEIAGGLAGSAVAPGPGTFAGAVGGAMVGGGLGQAFNDMVLQLSGVYDRSGGEEAAELGIAAGLGGAGSAVGRAVAGAGPQIKGAAKQALPKAAAEFLGADEEGLRLAIQMREKGVELVPPSMWAKEAPHLQNLTEVLDPAFRTQQPLKQAAEQHFEKSGSEILSGLNAQGKSPIEAAFNKPEGSLINPEAKVSSKEAGEKLLLKAREESSQADADLAAQFEARKAALTAGGVPAGPDQQALRQAEAEARKAAQKLIDAGFQDIDKSAADAMTVAKAGSNSGDLWWSVAEKLKAVRQGIMTRAEKMYGEADTLAGGHLPDSSGLPELAQDFLNEIPPDFKTRYPSVVQKLEALGGKTDPETGEVIKEAVQPTFGQLHNIRSLLRDGADWYTLASDVKNGSFKYFAKAVDDVLHDGAAVPELKAAAHALDQADAFYAENMKVFNARNIKTVMDGLRAGEPADPTVLFNAIVKEGHSDLTKKVMEMIGPNLAAGVRAADVRTMLKNSESILPGQIDGMKFASEVLSRVRSDMLDSIHGPQMANKLREQAQNILALEGRIDIPVRPGDTALDVIGRARVAADEVKSAAKTDPMALLSRETKKIDNEQKRAISQAQRERKADPLGFLFNPTMGAVEAADKILASEDLILASAARFGEKSPEFNALRQIYAQRLLQSTMDVGGKLAGISPEIQNIMFPGVTIDQMKMLAKEMDALLGTKAMRSGAGKSIMATERVEHPWGAIPLGKAVGKLVPGWDAAGRGMLGKYYKTVTWAMNNLTFLRWVERGLKGDQQAREMTRQTVQRMMQKGGAVGAGAAESQFATPEQPQ